MFEALKGKKTYIATGLGILAALISMVVPDVAQALHIQVANPGQLLAEMVGLMFLRAGVAKVGS